MNAAVYSQWETTAQEWEKRFEGLQRTHSTKEVAWLQSQQMAEATIAKLTPEQALHHRIPMEQTHHKYIHEKCAE